MERSTFAIRLAFLFGGVDDLAIQVAGLMIPAKLAERGLVQLQQDLAKLVSSGVAGCEALTINLPQRTEQRMSVFAADFAIVVAVAVVETCLAHAALLLCPQPRASSSGDQMATQTRALTGCI